MAKKKRELTGCYIVAKAMREQGHDITEDEVERIYLEQQRLRKSNPLLRMMQDEMLETMRAKMKPPN
jgi:hypothetical protein